MPSVCVLTALGRRHDRYLDELSSCVAQLTRAATAEVEWVISMDTDAVSTPRVLSCASAAVPQSRVCVVPFPGSQEGPGSARTRALGEVSCEWIATIDSDDTFEPEGLLALVAAAVSAAVPWAAGNARDIDPSGAPLGSGPAVPYARGIVPRNSYYEFRRTEGRPPFHPSATVVRTAVARECGGWPLGWMRTEDTALWSVVNSKYEGWYEPVHVLNYRKHPASITASAWHEGSAEELMPVIGEMIIAGSTQSRE